MIIPEVVRVGSVEYEVKMSDTPLIQDGTQLLGLCDYYSHTIFIDNTMQDEQSQEITFLHELTHAMLFERKLHLEQYVEYNVMEFIVDTIAFALHQIVLDNPEIFLDQQTLTELLTTATLENLEPKEKKEE